MAGALRGDPQAEPAGGTDEGDDLLDGVRDRDGGRALVDRDVPGRPGRVVPRGAGEVDATRCGLEQRCGVEASGVGGGGGHAVLSLVGPGISGAVRGRAVPSSWTSRPGGCSRSTSWTVSAGLGEALGEHVEDRPDPVVVDGGDPQAHEVAGSEPGARQAVLDPGQGQRELGGRVVLVQQPPDLVQGGLGRDREGAAGHVITVAAAGRSRPSRPVGDFGAVDPGWAGPPRFVGCRRPARVRTIERCPPRP